MHLKTRVYGIKETIVLARSNMFTVAGGGGDFDRYTSNMVAIGDILMIHTKSYRENYMYSSSFKNGGRIPYGR